MKTKLTLLFLLACAATYAQTNLVNLGGPATSTPGTYNTSLGYPISVAITSGTENTFYGAYTGKAVTSGGYNTFIGSRAGQTVATTTYNTFVGYNSGNQNTGSRNTLMGSYSGMASAATTDNTLSGYYAGKLLTGSSNSFFGSYAGQSILNGSGNVFLGYYAGSGESTTASNKLAIANGSYNNTSTFALISGDFSSKIVGINALPVVGVALTVGGGVTSTGTVNAPTVTATGVVTGGSFSTTGTVLVNAASPNIYLSTNATDDNRFLSLYNSSALATPARMNTGGMLVADSYSYATPSKNDLIVKGHIAIGTPFTSNTNNFLLAVNGKAGATDLQVVAGPMPDYVFDADYKLPSLAEVQSYIAQHHHLEGVPSAAEVEKDGLSTSQMLTTLLKKVEELTLYTIEQQKQIEDLKRRVEANTATQR